MLGPSLIEALFKNTSTMEQTEFQGSLYKVQQSQPKLSTMMGTSNIKDIHNMSMNTDSRLILRESITFRRLKLSIRISSSLTILISIQARSRCMCKIIIVENSYLKCHIYTKSVHQRNQRAQVKKIDQDQCHLETIIMIQSKWSNLYLGMILAELVHPKPKLMPSIKISRI